MAPAARPADAATAPPAAAGLGTAAGAPPPEWLVRLLADSQLSGHLANASEWVEANGCAESDLREDEEAFNEIIGHLGLRKYDIKRLRKSLSLPPLQPQPQSLPESPPGGAPADAAAGGRAAALPLEQGSGLPKLRASPGLTLGVDDTGEVANEVPATAAASGAASPSSASDRPQPRRPSLGPLPEIEGEDAEGDADDSPPSTREDSSPRRSVSSWGSQPVKIPDGLSGVRCKNTFFEIPEDEDGRPSNPGPATCPLPTEGWWSCRNSDASPQVSPSPGVVVQVHDDDGYGPTPTWSVQGGTPSESSRPRPAATRKAWADATPDWFGPTPDLRHAQPPPAASAGAAGRPGAGGRAGSSHFNRLLAEEVGEESDSGGTTQESPPPQPPPPPPAPPSVPAPKPPHLAALGATHLQPFQGFPPTSAPNFHHLSLPCMAPPPPMVPPHLMLQPPPDLSGGAGGRVRLELARELGFQRAMPQRPRERERWGGSGAASRTAAAPPQHPPLRGGPSSSKRGAGREPREAATGRSKAGPDGFALLPTGAADAAALQPRRPRHRGSKEAKDPDPWPDDPFEGLPCGAFVDLGSLTRVPSGGSSRPSVDGDAEQAPE